MIGAGSGKRRQPQRRGSATATLMATVAVASGFILSLAAVALATGTVTISSASNSTLGKQIAVNAQGRTLYALGGESKSHLICTSAECLKFWPPVRVSSKSTKLKDGTGVHGKLGIIKRSGGILQMTLRGMPLYRFAGDKAKGEANGEGIVFPGGHVWHAVTAAASGASNTTPMSGAQTPAPSPTPAPTPKYHGPAY
jgi:predicted lipoprotein with Yx(FWY)xxD motif